MKRYLPTLGAIGLSAILAVAAFAHSGATGIVKERMDAMSSMGKAMKTLSGYVSGKVDYDANAVRSAAVELRKQAGETLIARFPAEPVPATSEARDTIWSDPDGFADIANQLEHLARKLEAVAANGVSGSAAPTTRTDPEGTVDNPIVARVFQEIGQTCKDCHSDYRVKK